jgi:glutathione S-transferase
MTPMERPALPAVEAWFVRLQGRPGFRLYVDNGMP